MLRRRKEQSGALQVELALMLPLFLVICFFAVWLGMWRHAVASLEHAVWMGVRGSVTRGDLQLVGRDPILDVETWYYNATGMPSTVRELIATDEFLGTADATYLAWAQEVFPGISDLRDLPKRYNYALIYALNGFRSSIRGLTRFPCEPSDPDGYGCVKCVYVNPESRDLSPFPAGQIPTVARYPAVGLQCEYRGGLPLLAALEGLIGLLSGSDNLYQYRVTRKAFIDPGSYIPHADLVGTPYEQAAFGTP